MVCEFCIQFACGAIPAHIFPAEVQESFLQHIVQGSVESDFAVAAACAEVMLVGEVPVLEEYVVPVRVGIGGVEGVLPLGAAGRKGKDGIYLSLLVCQNSRKCFLGEDRFGHIVRCVPLGFVVVVGEGPGIHLVHFHSRRTPPEIVVVVDLDFALLATLGGDENYPERCPAAVNARRCRIFKHGNGFYVLRIDCVEVSFHSVNQDEGIAARAFPYGGGSPDVHTWRFLHRTAAGSNLKSRHQTLKCGSGIGYRTGFKGFGIGNSHGPSEIDPLLYSISDDYYLFECLNIVFQDYVHDGSPSHRLFCRLVSYGSYSQYVVRSCLYAEIAVQVSHLSYGCTLDLYRGGYDALSVSVRHFSLHSLPVCIDNGCQKENCACN